MKLKYLICFIVIIILAGCNQVNEEIQAEIDLETSEDNFESLVLAADIETDCEKYENKTERQECYWRRYLSLFNKSVFYNEEMDVYEPDISTDFLLREFDECQNDFCREFIYYELLLLDKSLITESVCDQLPIITVFLNEHIYPGYFPGKIDTDDNSYPEKLSRKIHRYPQITCKYKLSEDQEAVDSTEAEEIVPQGKDYTFDDCGSVGKYYTYSFFDDFVEQLVFVNRRNMEYVTDLCYSEDAGILIGIIGGGYMELGEVFKYDVDAGILNFAKVDIDEEAGAITGAIFSFGERNGDYIEIQGTDGDAGYFLISTYYYYYDSNLLVLKRICDNYVGGEVEFDMEASQCTDY